MKNEKNTNSSWFLTSASSPLLLYPIFSMVLFLILACLLPHTLPNNITTLPLVLSSWLTPSCPSWCPCLSYLGITAVANHQKLPSDLEFLEDWRHASVITTLLWWCTKQCCWSFWEPRALFWGTLIYRSIDSTDVNDTSYTSRGQRTVVLVYPCLVFSW